MNRSWGQPTKLRVEAQYPLDIRSLVQMEAAADVSLLAMHACCCCHQQLSSALSRAQETTTLLAIRCASPLQSVNRNQVSGAVGTGRTSAQCCQTSETHARCCLLPSGSSVDTQGRWTSSATQLQRIKVRSMRSHAGSATFADQNGARAARRSILSVDASAAPLHTLSTAHVDIDATVSPRAWRVNRVDLLLSFSSSSSLLTHCCVRRRAAGALDDFWLWLLCWMERVQTLRNGGGASQLDYPEQGGHTHFCVLVPSSAARPRCVVMDVAVGQSWCKALGVCAPMSRSSHVLLLLFQIRSQVIWLSNGEMRLIIAKSRCLKPSFASAAR